MYLYHMKTSRHPLIVSILVIKRFINSKPIYLHFVEKKTKFTPNNWEVVLQNIREMRKQHPAPVDTMGCEKCADSQANAPTQRYQILVALMLSSQTKDGK